MTRARLDGLYMLLLGASMLLPLVAFILVTTSPIPVKRFQSYVLLRAMPSSTL
jgi:hypothetical protein